MSFEGKRIVVIIPAFNEEQSIMDLMIQQP